MTPITSRRLLPNIIRHLPRVVLALGICVLLTGLSGCSRPEVPDMSTITGPGRLRDITQVRRGMSPNEVRRIMGSKYKTVYEEGLHGMDMGIYFWEYNEGRVYFKGNNAFKAVAY